MKRETPDEGLGFNFSAAVIAVIVQFPTWITRLQKRPRPWMDDANTPTASLAFLARCLNLMAMGRSRDVARRVEEERGTEDSRSRPDGSSLGF